MTTRSTTVLRSLIILLLLALLSRPDIANASEHTCDVKNGPSKITIGVLSYFASVMTDAVEKIDGGVIELHNDYLCWAPSSAQPVLIATAEHLLYLAFEVLPSMSRKEIRIYD